MSFDGETSEVSFREKPSIAHSLKIYCSHIQHKPTKWRIRCLQLNWRLSSKVTHNAVIRGTMWDRVPTEGHNDDRAGRDLSNSKSNGVFWMLLLLYLFRMWLTENWCLKADTHFNSAWECQPVATMSLLIMN